MASKVKRPWETGGLCMRSGGHSSRAIPIAGPDPVTVFTNRIAMGERTKTGRSRASVTKAREMRRVTASAMLPDSKCMTKLLMEVKMRLPSWTAETMVAKLSSAMTMSATPLVTSEPVMPIATPTSACLMAGESLTPSPVIATTFFLLCSASTILTLEAGEERATMRGRSTIASSSASVMLSSTGPVMIMPLGAVPSGMIPISFAMASAVEG
mmetsp:Transcript_31611/g.62518  ORF Transcript_31611/g.62518 Transcript_31611/m.62518 type:complete len:212 (-) Transcript_31611:2068-2703(-)